VVVSFFLLQVPPLLFSHDSTVLAMMKPKKYQRLADPLLLQSGVVTRNNRV